MTNLPNRRDILEEETFESGKLYLAEDVLFEIKLSVRSIQKYQCSVPIQLTPFGVAKEQWMGFIDSLCDIFKKRMAENGGSEQERPSYFSLIFCTAHKDALLDDEEIYASLLDLVRTTSSQLENNGIYLVIKKDTNSILVVKIHQQ